MYPQRIVDKVTNKYILLSDSYLKMKREFGIISTKKPKDFFG